MLKSKKTKIDKAWNEKDFFEYVIQHDRRNRAIALSDVIPVINDDNEWRELVAYFWQDSEHPSIN